MNFSNKNKMIVNKYKIIQFSATIITFICFLVYSLTSVCDFYIQDYNDKCESEWITNGIKLCPSSSKSELYFLTDFEYKGEKLQMCNMTSLNIYFEGNYNVIYNWRISDNITCNEKITFNFNTLSSLSDNRSLQMILLNIINKYISIDQSINIMGIIVENSQQYMLQIYQGIDNKIVTMNQTDVDQIKNGVLQLISNSTLLTSYHCQNCFVNIKFFNFKSFLLLILAILGAPSLIFKIFSKEFWLKNRENLLKLRILFKEQKKSPDEEILLNN